MHQMRRVSWKEKLHRSGYFFAAVLFHLVLFLMVATVVVIRYVPPTPETESFKRLNPTELQPRHEPDAPPAASSPAENPQFDPSDQVIPMPMQQSVIVSDNKLFKLDVSKELSHAHNQALLLKPRGTELNPDGGIGPQQGPGTAPFGSPNGTGNQLVGYLYDFKQTPEHDPTGLSSGQYHQRLKQFVADDWDPRDLEGYYKSAQPLYTSAILIPVMDAQLGPTAFGLQNEVKPSRWIIWYKGTVTPPAPGRYQFAGICDDILLVRIDGHTVLDGSLSPVDNKPFNLPWNPAPGQAYRPLRLGEEFTLSPGESKNIDVIIGEEPGGRFYAALFALKVGETYPNDTKGQPELPLFQIGSDYKLPGGVYPSVNPTVEAWQGNGR
jgi:hypothetical protein